MKKILITNVYGGYNIGDMAIRNEGLKIIEEASREKEFTLLCESIDNFPLNKSKNIKYKLGIAPYGYAIRSKGKPLPLTNKALRFMTIISKSLIYTLFGLISENLIPKQGFYKYIREIKSSDLVISMGGGYFITAHPLKDFFGIGLNVLPLYLARIYNKPIVVLPSSFGPFAHKIHESMVGNAIKNQLFMAREEISLKKVSQYTNKAIYMPDLAIYDNNLNYMKKKNNFVLTFREGLNISREEQLNNEQMLVTFIKKVWNKYKLQCIFIPMASNPIEENDLTTAQRINSIINDPRIYQIKHFKTPTEVKSFLKDSYAAVCNRLHSAILSATVGTPFISIAYAHKTNGFMNSFNLSEWNINVSDLTEELLWKKFERLAQQQNYARFIKTLESNHKKIEGYREKIIELIEKSIPSK